MPAPHGMTEPECARFAPPAAGGDASWAALRRVAANVSWLTLNQALAYVLPLATTPVLTHAFGPDVYGIYSTGLAYGAYATLLVTYGFNYYGPRAVALARGDGRALRRIYAAILTVQSSLALAAVALCGAILPAVQSDRVILIIDVVLVAQAALAAATPLWLFVGIEDLRNVSLAQCAGRLALFAATLAIVRRPADLLPLSGAMLTIVAVTLLYTLREARRAIGASFPLRKSALREVLRDAAPFFWSSLAVSVYASSTIIVVSAILGPAAAGYFALADKLRVAAVSVTAPLTQTVYPLFNKMAQATSPAPGDLRMRRIFVGAMLLTGAAASAVMFGFAPVIVHLLGGREFGPAIRLLHIMAPVPLIVSLSNILGRQTLIPWGHVRLFMMITFVAAGFGLASIAALVAAAGVTGAACSVLFVESFVAAALAAGAWRKGLIRRAFAFS